MNIQPNTYRAALLRSGQANGAVVQLGSPETVEIIGHLGFDFVFIDAEHGTFDLSLLVSMFRAAQASNVAAIVRVPDLTPSFITRVLDAGASGVVGPHVRTAADARALVRAVKFGPAGERGACPATRATRHGLTPWPEFMRHADQDTIVWALVEDMEGVDNIESIVDVPGLDAVLFGPFDLSLALGHGGRLDVPEIAETRARVQAACARSGVDLVSIVNWEPGGAAGAKTRGARVLLGSGDRSILRDGLRTSLESMRATLPPPAPENGERT